MSKKTIDINSVAEAIERLNNAKTGDHVIVRAMSITVPTPSFDMAITNATMQLMLNNFENPDNKHKYDVTTLEEGQYEVVTVFHLRKVSKPDMPMLN